MVRSLIQTAAVAATLAWYTGSTAAAPVTAVASGAEASAPMSGDPRASGMPHGHGHGHIHSKECNSQVSGVPTALPGVSSADSPPLPTASAVPSDSAPTAEPSGVPSRRHGGGYSSGGDNSSPGSGGDAPGGDDSGPGSGGYSPGGDNSGPGSGGKPGSEEHHGDCSGTHGGPSAGAGEGSPHTSAKNPGTVPTYTSGPANPTESGTDGTYSRRGGYDAPGGDNSGPGSGGYAPGGDNSGPGSGGKPGSEGHHGDCRTHGGPSAGASEGSPHKSADNPGSVPTYSASGPANPTESGTGATYSRRRITKLSRMNALN